MRGCSGAAGGGALAGAATRRGLSTQAAGAAAKAAASAPAPASASPAGSPALLRRLLSGRLGQAARLQLAAAWQAWGPVAYTAVAMAAVYLLWRFFTRVTNTFISVNESLAEYGFMGLAVTLVTLGALYARWRVVVNPAAVYRQAMVRLNTHPGVLEVMGAPLVGSDVRAYVVTGGGLYLSKSFRIKVRSRRIQMMFPLSGPERKGLASLEAKRKQGQYVWKLLAVDLGPELQHALPAGGATSLSAAPPRPAAPAAPPPPQHRVYVVGDLETYQRGGVLGELRGPFLQALGNSRSYEVEDELEDELDELTVPRGAGGGAAGGGLAGSARAVSEAVVGGIRKAVGAAAAAMGPPAVRPDAAGAGAATEAGASGATQKQVAEVTAAEAGPAPAAKEGVKSSDAPSAEQKAEMAAEAEGTSAAGDGKGSGPGWLSNLRRAVLGPGRS